MPDLIETTDAVAGTSTAYALTVGQTAQGTLTGAGDHDWYRVDLVAGQTYSFAMVGTGSANVQDPFLRLYAPGGTAIVVQDNNSLQGLNSSFSYTAAASGSYFIDAGANNNAGLGQYGVCFTAGTRASFDIQMGGGVIDTDLSWTSTPGTSAIVTVGFRQTDDGSEPNFSQFSAQQIAATLMVLQSYSDVCGLNFNVVNSGGHTNNATILLANYNTNDGSGGYAYYPGSTAANAFEGNIYINLAGGSSATSIPVGSYSYATLLHEMGHAVGLSHPGKYNAAPGVSIIYGNSAQFIQDTNQFSIMSYFSETNTAANYAGSDPDTLMLYDVYALQQIYGANTSTRSGDTIYGFNGNVGGIYDFSTNSNPTMCIWDGGGSDTLDVSGFDQNQLIDLNPGAFSNIGSLIRNVSIAFGAVIENAVGGSGADHIYLSRDPISNVINGRGGTDTVHVTYAYGNGYAVTGIASSLMMVGAAGDDTLQNVEFVIFSDGAQVSTVDLTSAVPQTNFVTISDVAIAEGNSGAKLAIFTVTRTGGVAAFAVNYTTSDGTATAGSDYLASSGTLNFAAGVNSQTISITIDGDTAIEPNETFFVDLSGASGGAVVADSEGQATIIDDDLAPIAGDLSIADVTITEGNGGTQQAVFTVARTGGTGAFSVNFATANGTAAAGSDYIATSGTLSFAAGVNSQAISVAINGDTTVESNETFFLNLSGGTNAVTIVDSQGQGTIIDNDAAGDDFADTLTDVTAPFGVLSVAGSATGNLEAAGDRDWFSIGLTAGVSVTIDLLGAPTGAGTLSDPYLRVYSSTGILLAQDDDAGVDLNSRVLFTPSTSGTFYLAAAAFGDTGRGTYTLSVAAPLSTAGSVTISDLTITEGDGGIQLAIFTVARTGGTGAFAVNYATANGTANAGSDYIAAAGTLNFAAGINTQTISVAVNGDTAVEPNETFFITLSSPTNGAIVTDTQGQGTIVDNDAAGDDFADSLTDATAPLGVINIGSAVTGNLEGAGDHDWFSVQLTAGVRVTIDLQGAPSSAGTLGDPYLYLFDAVGQLIAEDDDAGAGLNARLVFSPSVSGRYYVDAAAYSDLTGGTYTVNVTAAASSTSLLSILSDVTVTEGHSGTQVVTFTVARSGGIEAFSANYATANGTAAAGTDYVSATGTLNFGVGVNSQTISVTINGDAAVEPNETFFINLSGASNGVTITDGQGQCTIVDDDTVDDDYRDSFTDTTALFGHVTIGSVVVGSLESPGDRDWFGVQLTAGIRYPISLQGQETGGGTLEDPYVRLHSSAGLRISEHDDLVNGVHRDSQLIFTPTVSDIYYVNVGAFDDKFVGTYTVAMSSLLPTAGTANNDFFNAGDVDRIFDGLGGHDSVVFHGPSDQFVIVENADGSVTVTDLVNNRDDINQTIDVEYLKFSDRTIFVETTENASVARLYSAALDREPDTAGLGAWIDFYAEVPESAKAQGPYVALAKTPLPVNGLPIAAGFTMSSEFQSRYGSLNDQQFVSQLYENVLDRPADVTGLDGWLSLMATSGFTREMVLVGFSESVENISKTAEWLITI